MFTMFKVNEEPLISVEAREAAFRHSLRKSRSIYRTSTLKKIDSEDQMIK